MIMACNDGGVPYPPTREEVLNEKVPTAMLCAILRVCDKHTAFESAFFAMLSAIDWKQAGITPAELHEWWQLHKKRDARG
jgi:hypothetical protein